MNKNKLKRDLYKAIKSEDWFIDRSRWREDNTLHIGIEKEGWYKEVCKLQDQYGIGKVFSQKVDDIINQRINLLKPKLKKQVPGIKKITREKFWSGHASCGSGIRVHF